MAVSKKLYYSNEIRTRLFYDKSEIELKEFFTQFNINQAKFRTFRKIAQNQIESLYRRMKYHPEKCSAYSEEIKKVIIFELNQNTKRRNKNK
jgi:hypothetical protein